MEALFGWRLHIWISNGEILFKHGAECGPESFGLLGKWRRPWLVYLNERDIIDVLCSTALLWLE
jgi:hypothetical protein